MKITLKDYTLEQEIIKEGNYGTQVINFRGHRIAYCYDFNSHYYHLLIDGKCVVTRCSYGNLDRLAVKHLNEIEG